MAGKQSSKLRGVNLGGWLVLERWITPSVFEGSTAPDEYSLMQEPAVASRVERHRREFIVEGDFAWLSKNGVNAVRIPVGYWIFDGDAPFTACVSYLDWAVKMAEKYKLKVLVDLHATPGSQNGNDHSGRVGEADWYRDASHREATVATLVRLTKRYRDSPALWGVELLNEPSVGVVKYFKLLAFYRRAYREVTKVARPGTRVVFSDGFLPWLFSGALRKRGDYPPVMDVHWYQFGYARLGKYFSRLARKTNEISWLQRCQKVIVGEWSGMLSHRSLAGMPKQQQIALEKEHIQRQLAAYEAADGWFYWTYKTESSGIWNFRTQVENGSLLLR